MYSPKNKSKRKKRGIFTVTIAIPKKVPYKITTKIKRNVSHKEEKSQDKNTSL